MNHRTTNSTKNKTYIIKGAMTFGSTKASDVIINNGHIGSTIPSNTPDSNTITLDANGQLLIPGFVDLYSRCREPGQTRKGTIASESIAALSSGFTHVLCSPDTSPVVDNIATVELITRRSKQVEAGANIIPMAALTLGLHGEQLSELATLQSAGCPIASQADQPIDSANVLYSAMEYASSFNMPLLMTARDAQLGIEGCAHTGEVSTRLGLPAIPIAAETVELSRLIELCRETGCNLHISRISSARAVEQISDAKQAGLPVTCDVGIHHLFYTDELLAGYDASFHSRVPFRSVQDRDQLRVGLANGIIDCICSDHAPHDIDASLAPFPATEPGLSAYDWFIPLMLQIPRITDLDLDDVIGKLHHAPHKILGNSPTHFLAPDAPASFFLLDVHADCNAANIDTFQPLSSGKNNPLKHHAAQKLGLERLRGKVSACFHNGWASAYT